MDLKGQRLAERLYQILFALIGAAGFIYGFVVQNFDHVLTAWVCAMGVSMLVCLPDFPMYNGSPVTFVARLPEQDVAELKAEAEAASQEGWFGGRQAQPAAAASGGDAPASSSRKRKSGKRKTA